MFKYVSARMQRIILYLAILTWIVIGVTFACFNILRFRLTVVWNLFLAVIPLGFTLLIQHAEHKKAPFLLRLPLWLLWLFFYPNAPYMTTDLLHLSRYEFYVQGRFSGGWQPWLGMLHLVTGVAVGVACGAVSLYLLHRLVKDLFSRGLGWAFVFTVSLLSGFALYLGRVLRFNSWDLATRPLYLAGRIWESISPQMILLCLIFSLMALLPYLFFYLCTHREEETA